MNCGDWVESCTALAEHEDGTPEIIIWTDPSAVLHQCLRPPPARPGTSEQLAACPAFTRRDKSGASMTDMTKLPANAASISTWPRP